VVFEAGFSGGWWKELDGYKVMVGSLQQPYYRRCPRASQVTSVQTKGGLRLGLTREQLIALLGAPKETRGNKLSFPLHRRHDCRCRTLNAYFSAAIRSLHAIALT
jgi:hypothetical protein